MTDDITQKPQPVGEIFTLPENLVLKMQLAMARVDAANAKAMIFQRDAQAAQEQQKELVAQMRELASEGGKYVLVGVPGGPPDSFQIDPQTNTCRRVRVTVEDLPADSKTG